MSSTQFEKAVAVYDAVDAALRQANEVAVDALSDSERLQLLQRRQTWRRMAPAGEHELINELAHASPDELGGSLPRVLADALRIGRSEARRLIEEAADLGPRRALTGELLPPKLEATAAAQREGLIDGEHIAIIRGFVKQLPHFIDEPTKEAAEAQLAAVASARRPDELERAAAHLDAVLNPDGTFSDKDRARRRGFTVGPQGADGMSYARGWLTPEARAGWDAVTAKWAAPGVCNPADEHPVVHGDASPDAIAADCRSAAQRNHDAFTMLTRCALTCGELGSHQGLPVTIVATATLQDLQAKTGTARTATGTRLPITDVIRMAAQAYHFLLLFDHAKPIALYKGRSTRLATPAQRLVLYATERGCTRPAVMCPPLGAKSTTSRIGPKAGPPTSTISPWPADPITAWSTTTAGTPARTTRVRPSGFRHLTWTPGNHEPTPTGTRRSCCPPKTMTSRTRRRGHGLFSYQVDDCTIT